MEVCDVQTATFNREMGPCLEDVRAEQSTGRPTDNVNGRMVVHELFRRIQSSVPSTSFPISKGPSVKWTITPPIVWVSSTEKVASP